MQIILRENFFLQRENTQKIFHLCKGIFFPACFIHKGTLIVCSFRHVWDMISDINEALDQIK